MPYQIMYSSQATVPLTVAGLEAILADARAGNVARNVTGALVYVDDVFFQIIEGDREVVENLMANIARDTRHHSVTVIYEAEIESRAFESWSMAFVSATARQMSEWAGLAGTATVRELLADINRTPNRVPGMLVNILNVLSR
jgi:Sensors of blue-light using FAD